MSADSQSVRLKQLAIRSIGALSAHGLTAPVPYFFGPQLTVASLMTVPIRMIHGFTCGFGGIFRQSHIVPWSKYGSHVSPWRGWHFRTTDSQTHRMFFSWHIWSRFALVKVLVGGKNPPKAQMIGRLVASKLHFMARQESPGRKYARQASDCADFSWNQWILVRGSFSVAQHLPFGKHTKNDGKIYQFIAGKIHYFDWAMASMSQTVDITSGYIALFTRYIPRYIHFIANCLFTRPATQETHARSYGQVPPPILWEEGWTTGPSSQLGMMIGHRDIYELTSRMMFLMGGGYFSWLIFLWFCVSKDDHVQIVWCWI